MPPARYMAMKAVLDSVSMAAPSGMAVVPGEAPVSAQFAALADDEETR